MGRKVRRTIHELGGTMPEKPPIAASIKKVESREKKRCDYFCWRYVMPCCNNRLNIHLGNGAYTYMKASELEKKFGKKKRKTISELKQVMLARPDANPNFCLFLGAGASRSSAIRTASQMVDEWRMLAYKGLSKDDQERPVPEMKNWLTENESEWYDEKAEYSTLIEHIYPLRANRRKFIEIEVADKIPSIGYAYLVRIAEAGLLRTLFTTNFDDLLNEAFLALPRFDGQVVSA